MYGLPKNTEISKQLPKALIYRKYVLAPKEQKLIDDNISRLDIVNEISVRTTSLAPGKSVVSFFIIKVQQKSVECSSDSLLLLDKLIGQKCIYALSFLGKTKFACNNIRLFTTPWIQDDKAFLSLNGHNMDLVWTNIQAEVIGVDHVEETGLEFQVIRKIKLDDMTVELEKLKKAEKKEVQPRRKQEIHAKVIDLKNRIEEMEGNPLLG